MSTTSPMPPARRWPWILAAALITAALVVAAVTLNNEPDSRPAAELPSTPSSSSASPVATSQPAEPVEISAPTGCLAGPDRDTDMVLDTIAKAPHTSNGAVEFAASITRWLYQRPAPAAADVERIQESAVSSSAADTNIAAYYARNPEMVAGLGTTQPFHLSTAPGVYLLESFTPTSATVTIGTGIVLDGALAPSKQQSATITAVWTDGGWRLTDVRGTRDVESLFTSGTPFTGGC